MKRLILTADGLGSSAERDKAVVAAHRQGILTSASLAATGAAAEGAAALSADNPGLGIGLLLDLPDASAAAVLAEARAQLRRFRELLGRNPTHLATYGGSHQDRPAALEAVVTLSWETGLPVRGGEEGLVQRLRGEGIRTTDRFVGDLHGGPAAEDDLVRALESAGTGTTEVACHPADPAELSALTGRAVRQAIQASGLRLIHFGQL